MVWGLGFKGLRVLGSRIYQACWLRGSLVQNFKGLGSWGYAVYRVDGACDIAAPKGGEEGLREGFT